jgi:peptidyl-prolyl cis-trans isomerase A (cyclophilin A)
LDYTPVDDAGLSAGGVEYHLPMKMPTLLVLVACAALVSGCSSGSGASPAKLAAGSAPLLVSMKTTQGEILLELDGNKAPITVNNFLMHAANHDYDGTIFHRVIPGFVIQGGGFTKELKERARMAEQAGRKDPAIKNEWTNGLRNVRGTIAMAREAGPDTATREFYINVADNPKLDTPRKTTGKAGYAVFGRVVKGMEVVDAIKSGKTMDRPDVIVDGEGMKNVPVEPVVIVRVGRVPGR